jgi:hypothetical protein
MLELLWKAVLYLWLGILWVRDVFVSLSVDLFTHDALRQDGRTFGIALASVGYIALFIEPAEGVTGFVTAALGGLTWLMAYVATVRDKSSMKS